MNKINWINGQAGGTPLSAENLNLMQDNIEDAINEVLTAMEGTTLYENSTGTKGDVILSDSAENYDIIEIFYTSGSRSGSVRVRDFLNNEKISLNLTGTSVSSFVNVVKEITISETTITKILERTFMVSGAGNYHTFDESDSVYIKKVIGYKY